MTENCHVNDRHYVSAARLAQQVGAPVSAVLDALASLAIEPIKRLGSTDYFPGGASLRIQQHLRPTRMPRRSQTP